MPPTSRDVVALAQACAVKVDLPRKLRSYPSFSEVEEQCGGGDPDEDGLVH